MRQRRADSASNLLTVREWANQVFSRASGAPLREGNQVTLLKDASENYPAWLTAIGDARQTIDFEMYIIHVVPRRRNVECESKIRSKEFPKKICRQTDDAMKATDIRRCAEDTSANQCDKDEVTEHLPGQ